MQESKHSFLHSNAIRGLLSIGMFIAFIWPYFAPEALQSLWAQYLYYTINLFIAVGVALAVSYSDRESEGDN